MSKFAKIAAFVGMLMALQAFAPPTGRAQVDPCEPVPIPELCEEPSPSPSPSPSDDGKGGGDGGGGGGGGGSSTGGGKGGGKGGGGQEVGDGVKGQSPGGKKGGGKKDEELPPEPRFSLGGTNDSSRLIAILEKLEPRVPLRRSLLEVAGPFPVAGLSYWSNDWHACRDGCDRLHKGLDMFAEEDTPLVAIADGVITQKVVGELAGISVEITDAHGIEYFYAHMSRWADGIRVGQDVERGQVIGFVGRTGNARHTPPHLHLEIQPEGISVPPKPFVDRWLKLAEARALELASGKLQAGDAAGLLAQPSDYRMTRLFDLGGSAVTEDTGEVLALAGFQPSVSSLEIARRLLDQMAWEIDWTDRTDAKLAALVEAYGRLLERSDLSGASPWSPLGSTHGSHGSHEEVGD